MARSNPRLTLVILCGGVLCGGWSAAFGADNGDDSHGFSFYERFQGSVNSLGAVNELDSSVGYNFNSHLSIDGGLPVYFIRPSSSSTATTGISSSNGIGNVYGQVRLTLANPLVNFASTATGTAPTGNKANGFSTGHATYDWTNSFDRTFSRITPFGDIGIANSVADTMFFVRPYTTYGFVTHVEGGLRYRLARAVGVGGSLYAILPTGQQTVISRLVKGQQAGVPSGGSGSGHGVFQNNNTTTGTAGIAQDRGLSAWVQVQPAPTLNLYAGYTHSTTFSLDTVFFGVGFNLGKAFRH